MATLLQMDQETSLRPRSLRFRHSWETNPSRLLSQKLDGHGKEKPMAPQFHHQRTRQPPSVPSRTPSRQTQVQSFSSRHSTITGSKIPKLNTLLSNSGVSMETRRLDKPFISVPSITT